MRFKNVKKLNTTLNVKIKLQKIHSVLIESTGKARWISMNLYQRNCVFIPRFTKKLFFFDLEHFIWKQIPVIYFPLFINTPRSCIYVRLWTLKLRKNILLWKKNLNTIKYEFFSNLLKYSCFTMNVYNNFIKLHRKVIFLCWNHLKVLFVSNLF